MKTCTKCGKETDMPFHTCSGKFPHLNPVTTQPVKPLLRVSVGDGKYTVVQFATGGLHALRYGEPWRDCCGDKLIYALAAEVEALRREIEFLQQGAHRG